MQLVVVVVVNNMSDLAWTFAAAAAFAGVALGGTALRRTQTPRPSLVSALRVSGDDDDGDGDRTPSFKRLRMAVHPIRILSDVLGDFGDDAGAGTPTDTGGLGAISEALVDLAHSVLENVLPGAHGMIGERTRKNDVGENDAGITVSLPTMLFTVEDDEGGVWSEPSRSDDMQRNVEAALTALTQTTHGIALGLSVMTANEREGAVGRARSAGRHVGAWLATHPPIASLVDSIGYLIMRIRTQPGDGTVGLGLGYGPTAFSSGSGFTSVFSHIIVNGGSEAARARHAEVFRIVQAFMEELIASGGTRILGAPPVYGPRFERFEEQGDYGGSPSPVVLLEPFVLSELAREDHGPWIEVWAR